MELTPLVGVLSLAVIALAAITAYRWRIESRRSEARIAALAAAIDDPRWPTSIDEEEAVTVADAPQSMSFVVPDVDRPSRAPAFIAAGVVVVAVGALLALGMSGTTRTRRPAQALPTSSIELTAMRHALDDETLIVTGAVRNPSQSATPALSAVVSVLGQDGAVVARGESRLEPVVLEPGKETTFRVSVPDVASPGRYRVAFVNGSQIVPHVDRRSDLARTALANDARGN
jgi:hypothetical protein